MSLINKLIVKKDFYKAVEGHATDLSDINLYYFDDYVYILNRMIKEFVVGNLREILFLDIEARPKHCMHDAFYFSIPHADHDMLRLKCGVMAPVSNEDGITILYDEGKSNGQLKILSEAYEKIMDVYQDMEVPITKRVSFAYNFANGYYFKLANGDSEAIKIFYHHDDCLDTDDEYYYPWEDFEVLVKRISIPASYKEELENIINTVKSIINEYDNKLGLIKIRRIPKPVDLGFEDDEIIRYQISEDELFEVIDGIKCVKEEWQESLAYLDLANISFKDVNVKGLDFRNCNAVINSNIVYNHDLSGCIFNGDTPEAIEDDCLDTYSYKKYLRRKN